MSLSDLAALGSFVSGIAVVATLGFLVVQMRQANRNQRSLMQQARSDRTMAALREFASPHFSAIVEKLSERKALTAAEANMLQRTISGYFLSVEDSFLQYEAGTLDATSWLADRATITELLRDPTIRATWRLVRRFFSGRYQALIDDIVQQNPAIPLRNGTLAWNEAFAEEVARAEAGAAPASPGSGSTT